MCHWYVEESKKDPDGFRRQDVMNDIKAFERMVEKYMGAKMEDYRFVRYDY